MPLTDTACRNAKPGPKPRKMADAGNLYLLVQPTGSRLWRWNYRFDGKQKTMAFGKYPEVSLSEARTRRDEARMLLASGLDPADPKPVDAVNFEEVAREWITSRIDWSPGHLARVLSRIEEDLIPQFGHIAVSQLDAPTILAAMRKIEGRGAFEVAKRLRQTVGQIMRYAIATGRASRDPAADLRGAMKPSPRVRHMAALREGALGEFMQKLDAYQGDTRTRLAIELVMRTFVRTGELRGARWSEVDGDLWRIPADRMKMGKEHVVPLPPQCLAILDQLRSLGDPEFVCRMSENTMIYGMYRMGYHSRATVHGFRSTASTILNESGLWSPDAIERQLAHVPANVVRSAYNAAQYLPERRRMMLWWNDFLDEKKVSAD